MEDQQQQPINNIIILSQLQNLVNNRKSRKNLGKSIYEVYNLDKIGSIKYAKIHKSANRPLYKNKNKDFNKQTEFCKCCNLPAQQEGIIEKFSFWDDPDSFIECGEGISLYFTFFKFAMIAMITTFLLSSIYNIIFSKKYYDELYYICNRNHNVNTLNEEDCKLFSEESKKVKSYSLISNSFFFMFNSINTKFYRNLSHNLDLSNNTMIKLEKTIVNTSFMNFLCLITLFIFNIVSIILINLKTQEINMTILSLSDYSIFISNLNDILKDFIKKKKEIDDKKENSEKNNILFNYEEELYKNLGIDKSIVEISELDTFICFLKNKICINEDGGKLNIKKINICFKTSELMKLEKKLHRVCEKMSKIRNHPYQVSKNEELKLENDNRKYFNTFLGLHCCGKSQTLMELKEKEQKLKEDLNKLMEKTKEKTMDYFAGCAIICLDKIDEQEIFLEKNSNNLIIYIFKLLSFVFCGCCFNKNKKDIYWLRRKIRFERAPEPEDIIFENLEIKTIERIFRTILVYFCSFVLICISFVLVTALNYLQKYTDEKNDFHIVVAYIISLLISLCIQIINIIFQKILDFLTKREKPSTTTNYFLSKSIKLTLFSFTNQGIIPLISELYNETNGYEYLIINMLMIFLVNSIVVPFSWTISFSFLYKKFRIWLIERSLDPIDPDGNLEKTQRELNDLYELPSMKISEKYSYIFKTLLLSFFYIQIFPLGVAISLVGFCLGYLLEKYNFCNMYKRPEMLNDKLCKVYINNFIVALFVSGIGDYVFKNDVYENRIWPLTNIIVFGVLFLIPYHFIIDKLARFCLNLRESKIHKNSLDEVYFSFFNDYERAKKKKKKEGIINYLKGLKKTGIVSEKTYKDNIENLDNVNLMKLYYDDKRNINAFKTQKTLMKGETIERKATYLVRKITYTVDGVIEEKLIEESIRGKDSFEAMGLSSNIIQNSNNISNDNDKNDFHDKKSSERKLKIQK